MNAEMIDLFGDNPRSLRGSSALIPTLQAALPLVRFDRSVTGINDIVHANAEMILEEMIQGIHDAAENGITIGMGTDSALTYVTHYNTWREPDFVVRYGGLSPAHALHAATQGNATILGIDDQTGTVAEGRSADLVLLDRNPLVDGFRAYADPVLVAVRGVVVTDLPITRYPEIDAMLDSL